MPNIKLLALAGLSGLLAPHIYRGAREVLRFKQMGDVSNIAATSKDVAGGVAKSNEILKQIAATLKKDDSSV